MGIWIHERAFQKRKTANQPLLDNSNPELVFWSASGYGSPRWEFESLTSISEKKKKTHNTTKKPQPTAIRQFKSSGKLYFPKVCLWAAVTMTGVEHIATETVCHSKESQKKALLFVQWVYCFVFMFFPETAFVWEEISKYWKFRFEITFEVWSDPCIVAWHPPHQLIQEIRWRHWHAARSCTVCLLCGYQANSKEKQTQKEKKNRTKHFVRDFVREPLILHSESLSSFLYEEGNRKAEITFPASLCFKNSSSKDIETVSSFLYLSFYMQILFC